MRKQKIDPDDLLRSRFTSWLTALLRRARIDYLRKQSKSVQTISIEQISEAELAVYEQYTVRQTAFEFEEERLAKAFFSLPMLRQRILTLLFVEQMEPKEVAEALNCSENYVRVERTRALQALRKMLCAEEEWK